MVASVDIASVVDTTGVAVVTGGASGFGLTAAAQLLREGMDVALLDISVEELEAAAARLLAQEEGSSGKRGRVLAVRCNVADWASCEAAQREVAAAFPGRAVSFLFNNAGIAGTEPPNSVINASPEGWQAIFSVNVYGAVHILKAFVPGMVAAGPLPSGRKSFVVTSSSVVGLFNNTLGPYAVSKMACTALCEQFAIELESLGAKAAHVSPHTLHPSVSGTGFFNARGADGVKTANDEVKNLMLKNGIITAEDVVAGLFEGLQSGRHYIVVDHKLDFPTTEQLSRRLEDQMLGARPRKGKVFGIWLAASGMKEAVEKRKAELAELAKQAGDRRSRL